MTACAGRDVTVLVDWNVTVCGCPSWEFHVRYQKRNDRDNIINCLRRMGFVNKGKGSTYILCPMAGFLIVYVYLHGLAISVPLFASHLTLKFENCIYIYIYIIFLS